VLPRRRPDEQTPARGEIVARAKRTERAEARRRYRAALAAQAGEGPEEYDESEEYLEEEESLATATAPRGKVDPLQPDPVPFRPVGFMGAFKAAYRPVHYRADLKLFFPLITRTHAIWPVALISVVGILTVLIRRDPRDFFFQLSTSMILTPLPMLPAMIAGFLAPRATWLAGIIASLISSMAVIAWWESGAMPHFNTLGQVDGYQRLDPSLLPAAAIQLLWLAIPSGALLAALAGWYKRFLNLTGPAAQMAKQADRQKAKADARRQSTARR
jgi:hypothetical protein